MTSSDAVNSTSTFYEQVFNVGGNTKFLTSGLILTAIILFIVVSLQDSFTLSGLMRHLIGFGRSSYVQCRCSRRRSDAHRRNQQPALPGPRRIPIVGSVWMLGRNWFRSLADLRSRYGDAYRVAVGVREVVVLNGWRTVTTALAGGVRTARQLAGRPDLHGFSVASEGKTMSFNGYSAEWKLHRRLAEKALARAVSGTKFIETTVAREARILLETFFAKTTVPTTTTSTKTGSGEQVPRSFDPDADIRRSIAHVMFTLCYGDSRRCDCCLDRGVVAVPSSLRADPVKDHCDCSENKDFEVIIRCSECIVRCQGIGNIIDFFPWARHLLGSQLNTLDELCVTMLSATRRLVAEHRATHRDGVVRDVVDALIEAADGTAAGRRLGAERVEMTAQEFLGAGFDILAAATTWIVAYLAEYPEVQDRVRREVDAAIEASGGCCDSQSTTTSADQLFVSTSKTPYAEAVVLEVLRHSCVVPLALPHAAVGDTLINGYHVRSDTFVLVNLHSVCRDVERWPNADEFRPDRFMETPSSDGQAASTTATSSVSAAGVIGGGVAPCADDHRNVKQEESAAASRRDGDRPATVSFGVGKRRCVGEKLSRRVLTVYLTTLVRSCYVERPPGITTIDLRPRESAIILRPKPYKISVRPRSF